MFFGKNCSGLQEAELGWFVPSMSWERENRELC